MNNSLEPPTSGINLSTGTGFMWLYKLWSLVTGDVNGSNAAGVAITLGGSTVPFVVTDKGTVWIKGGTVTAVAITRATVSWTLGITSGGVPASIGDTITITYSSAPTVFLIPS